MVERDGASETMRWIDGTERLTELAQRLDGMVGSEQGLLNTENLLALAKTRRRM